MEVNAVEYLQKNQNMNVKRLPPAMVGRDVVVGGMVDENMSSAGKTTSREETQSLWVDFRCSIDNDVEGEGTADRGRQEGGKTADLLQEKRRRRSCREHDERRRQEKECNFLREYTKVARKAFLEINK
ncbi:hypothetical protein L1887_30627 [Cichorium endivia]|nr:hypothetical protein L1887_30627 [Cichorium endivia]